MISTSLRVALSAFVFAGALGLASDRRRPGGKRHEGVRRRLESRQGEQHDQRHDLAGLPEAVPHPEGEFRRSGRGSRRSARRGSRSRSDANLSAEARPRLQATPRGRPARANSPSEAEAKARCPDDTVVWVNTKGKSHAYHYAGTRWYGTTKQGAYMCEADARAPPATTRRRAGRSSPSSSPQDGADLREILTSRADRDSARLAAQLFGVPACVETEAPERGQGDRPGAPVPRRGHARCPWKEDRPPVTAGEAPNPGANSDPFSRLGAFFCRNCSPPRCQFEWRGYLRFDGGIGF